ncbi:hypothetical protein HNO88_001934 [Novosphingobium chloroacetimidivorans]|uniref:Beta-lactamase-related domain-containing protein n=1 Tax=Novosphingobium chloroacetimidivorans TaxID=1428314 RepID=A0A7W7NVK0_9SPHN|nr:serine hydrolase domain-containing protein [Novosphingobium chloroacetimidivorans]MBB4858608.1 hypothetical protein [Novosphingobium chloroacetimidivorans]
MIARLLGLATMLLAAVPASADTTLPAAANERAEPASTVRSAEPVAKASFSPDFLLGAEKLEAPRDLSAFAPPAGMKPGATIDAVLRLAPIAGSGGIKTYVDPSSYAAKSDSIGNPPRLEITIVSDGSALIPSLRGPIASDHPDWEWIMDPGTSWTDPADGGWSRAAVPFAFQERNANCTHNGVLTFLYRADGSTSRAAWEVAGETCAYFKADLWGMATVTLTPQAHASRKALIKEYRAEVVARVPTRPIEQIGSMFPAASPSQFGSPEDVKPDNMTAYGVLAGGIHWVGGCMTRHGAYPFCDVLALPSFSLAKSLFGGLALMRLEKLRPGIRNETIGAHVPLCSASQWADVRLQDALDMRTGHYDSATYEDDEGGAKMRPFFAADTRDDRERIACTMFPRRDRPGTTWVYHTVDTYLLGIAMQDVWKKRAGPDADIYRDLIVDPIWRPLGLSPVTFDTKRSYDAARQPLVGWGLTLHRDDVVRTARFLADGARIDGKPVVDPKMLGDALQRNPANRGAQAGAPNLRYKNGFWGWDVSATIGCSKPVWVPFLSGFGGISLAMFPNGVVYYYFSDGYEYAWRNAVKGANAIKPMCGQ